MDQESSTLTASGPGRDRSSNGKGGRRVSGRLRGSEPGRRTLSPLPTRPSPRVVARPAGTGTPEPLDLAKNQLGAGRDKSGDASGLLAAAVVPIPVVGEASGSTSATCSSSSSNSNPAARTSGIDCLGVRSVTGRAGLGVPAGTSPRAARPPTYRRVRSLNIRIEMNDTGVIRRVVDQDNNYIYVHTPN